MASLKFRHYATESDLKGTGTIQAALNTFDVGTIVFIDSTQKQYIITSKTNNVVTYKIYYGEPAVVSVSGSGAARTLTWSDGREETVTINDVDHATSADVSDTTKSVAWANVTGKPNIVTTDTEQIISGSKIFNNNTTFHNETDMESLTADSLLVTGSARFTNTINGNLKGNVDGNLTGNASTATTAATATEFSTNKSVTLTGDVTGSTSSKGGWSVATTIADGAVTNAKLANSKVTIAGTEVSLGGSIAASTIGNALTSDAPAAYATNAGTATKASEADKATKDSDGNAINTTYLKRSGGIMTGTINIGKTTNQDTDVMLRLTEYTNGSYLGGFINYDGANNILNIGVHDISDSNKSNDTNVISINRASANVGIGKINPVSKLDVNGTVTAAGFVGPLTGNVTGNASSATKATNDGSGNTITSTYATKTERANNDITAASLTASKLTLTRTSGNIEVNIPTWNQNTTGTAAKATADANGNNIINTYATKAEVAALPKSMVIKGILDASHSLPTSGMTEGDTYIVGSSGTYNKIVCKVGDFFVRTSNSWLRIPAGDEWEYNENTIKGIKVNNAVHADTAGTATSAGVATNATNSDKVDEFHAMSAGSLLYKYKVTATIPASSISGDFWYATITFSRNYSNELTRSLLSASYSNIAGQVYLNTYEFNGAWYAFTTSFNGSNIKGVALKTQNNPIYYVKLAKPIMHNNNIQDGTITVYSPYNCTIEVSATAPSNVTFTNLTIPGFTNLKANSAVNADTATTASSCSGNSATATKAGYLDAGTMTLYAHNNNEINFGGTYNSSTIYFGYRATESKPTPTSFIFGGHTGTATLTANGFKKKDSDASYVLTGDGGHALINGLSVNYATSSGACTGNAGTATKLETARTLWGQSFDGSKNISGDISNTGNIIPSVTKTSDLGSNALSYRYVYTTWVGAPGNTKLALGGSNATHLTIDTSGNVGIGTTSPTSKLHVAGSGYFTGDTSSAANIIAGGYIKGETIKVSSGCTLEYDSTQKCVKFVFS